MLHIEMTVETISRELDKLNTMKITENEIPSIVNSVQICINQITTELWEIHRRIDGIGN
jgi:hypothetical protein